MTAKRKRKNLKIDQQKSRYCSIFLILQKILKVFSFQDKIKKINYDFLTF
jgi:hypothetical protein